MSKQEEIIDAKRNIETIERKLKNLLDGYDGKDELKNDLIKSKKLDIILLREEIVDLQYDLMNEKLEEMKNNLKTQGLLYENSLGMDLTDINRMKKVVDVFKNIGHLQINIDRNQIVLDSNKDGENKISQIIEENRKQLNLAQLELNEKAEYFLKGFTLHQVQSGLMKENERAQIREQHYFNLNDVEDMFSMLSDSANNIQHTQNPKMTEELVKRAMPKCEIENIAQVSDKSTKEELCQLYHIQNSEDVQIFAIQNYNHTTLGEVSGMSKDEYQKLYGNGYDKEFGESITLYMFNKTTGKLEQMKDVIPKIVSKGEDIKVNDGLEKKEIATFAYKSLNLTYYIGENGKLHISKNIGDKLKDVSTDSLEPIEENKNMQEDLLNLQNTNRTKDSMQDIHNAQDPEEFREFLESVRRSVREARIREEMKGMKVSLEEKERLEKQENVFREKREGRIR